MSAAKLLKERAYEGKYIYIITGSIIFNYLKALNALALANRVQILWLTGNELTDTFAKDRVRKPS